MKEYVCTECGTKYEAITLDIFARPNDRASCQHCQHPMPPADENGSMLKYLLVERPGSTEPITDDCQGWPSQPRSLHGN